MIFDTHIHTEFSGDSQMKLSDAVKRAEELGIGLILTEHMDINDYMDRSGVDIKGSYEKFLEFKSENLLYGIELGMKEEAVERNIKIVEDNDFDFVLGSVHAPYDYKKPFEFFNKELYLGRTKKEVYEWYFQSMIRGIKENSYIDSLAHIDYICRYNTFEDKELYYREYEEMIDEVLKELIKRDISIEINTKRIMNSKSSEELIKIYSRFRDLGGEYVTIGSDAHTVERIGENFKRGLEIVSEIGLKPVYYKKRKREIME